MDNETIHRLEGLMIEQETKAKALGSLAMRGINALAVVMPMLAKIQPRLHSYDRMLNEERRHLAQQADAALQQAVKIMDGKE